MEVLQQREKRLFSRIACGLELVLTSASKDFQVTCRDLSLSGVGLEPLSEPLDLGDWVEVELEGFTPVAAEVCWAGDQGVGLRFVGDLFDVVDSWVGEVLAAHGIRVRDLTGGAARN